MKQLVYKNKSSWTTLNALFFPDWITKLVNEGCNIFGLRKIFDSVSEKNFLEKLFQTGLDMSSVMQQN